MRKQTLYKVLGVDGKPHHGGSGRWHLPTQHKSGKWKAAAWMPAIKGDLEPCANGYHLCRKDDLLGWLGPVIHIAEYDGELVEAGDKVVVRRVRLISTITTWNDRTARLFAADCAERALKKYWTDKSDERPMKAVQAARDFANGKIAAAARDAARDAAWDAARAAAGDAAMAAARAAAWDAERKWQTGRLFKYLDGDLP